MWRRRFPTAIPSFSQEENEALMTVLFFYSMFKKKKKEMPAQILAGRIRIRVLPNPVEVWGEKTR